MGAARATAAAVAEASAATRPCRPRPRHRLGRRSVSPTAQPWWRVHPGTHSVDSGRPPPAVVSHSHRVTAPESRERVRKQVINSCPRGDAARPGDTVQLLPGTYYGSVRITTPGLTLRGIGRSSVIAPGNAADGTAGDTVCAAAGHGLCVAGTDAEPLRGVTVEALAVTGFPKNGINIASTTGMTVRATYVHDNKLQGISQEKSTRAVIVGNESARNGQSGIFLANSVVNEGGATDTEGTLVSGNRLSGCHRPRCPGCCARTPPTACEVVAGADPRLRDGGAFAARARLVPGDCRVDIPVRADLYIIKNILEWDDESTRRTLANVVRAAKPGARVVVVENLVDDSPSMRFTTAMDLMLLLNVGGAKHSKESMVRLMEEAGLSVAGVREVNPYLHAFEATVPVRAVRRVAPARPGGRGQERRGPGRRCRPGPWRRAQARREDSRCAKTTTLSR
ncbi:right-handed parallel beta-helix repeat-containing protein [Kitasatospora sp. A2-31]|nr:right-handed parallel beta-helix repeat-containing protein [Kitasatospora sp. A2-31]